MLSTLGFEPPLPAGPFQDLWVTEGPLPSQGLLTQGALLLLPQVNDNLVLYDAAISACKACPESVDVQEAMGIYADMQRCSLSHLCQLQWESAEPPLTGPLTPSLPVSLLLCSQQKQHLWYSSIPYRLRR